MIGIVLSVILYQIAVSAVLYLQLSRLGASSVAGLGSIVASLSGSLVQLVFILIMGGVSGDVLLCGGMMCVWVFECVCVLVGVVGGVWDVWLWVSVSVVVYNSVTYV